MEKAEAIAHMINGKVDLQDTEKSFMSVARKIFSEAAFRLLGAVEETKKLGGELDDGSIIQAMQTMQEAKDIACQAVILPKCLRTASDTQKDASVQEPAAKERRLGNDPLSDYQPSSYGLCFFCSEHWYLYRGFWTPPVGTEKNMDVKACAKCIKLRINKGLTAVPS